MRIRQIKPSFWSDSKMSDLGEPTRLFFIGLWGIADDAGWFRWDTREVAHELYGYDSVRRRESRVDRMVSELATAGCVVLHPCGHVEVPKLPMHQHLGGQTRRVQTAFNEHLKECVASVSRTSPQIPAETREPAQIPALVRNGKGRERVEERNGQERLGNAGASANEEEPTEFRSRVPRPVTA